MSEDGIQSSSNPFLSLFGAGSGNDNADGVRIPSNPLSKCESRSDDMALVTPASDLTRVQCRVNELLESVFLVTVLPEHLAGDAESQHKEVRVRLEQDGMLPLSLDSIEVLLVDRLLMTEEQLNRSLVSSTGEAMSPPPSSCPANEKKPVVYLVRCFLRLQERIGTGFALVPEELTRLEGLICQSIVTGFEEDGIYPGSDPRTQFADMFFEYFRETWFAKFSKLVYERAFGSANNDALGKKIWNAPLSKLRKICAESTATNIPTRIVFDVLQFYASDPQFGELLIAFSTPRVQGSQQDPHLGRRYMQTLFGSILSLSVLPRQEVGPYEHFQEPSSMAVTTVSAVERTVHANLQNIQTIVHDIWKKLLTVSKVTKGKLLTWIGDCLLANKGRNSIAYLQPTSLVGVQYVSDGFMMNLGAILLRLCLPFVMNFPNPKTMRVNPWYCLFSSAERSICDELGIHAFRLSQETPLAASDEPIGLKKCDKEFSFITDCFFLTHFAISLGFSVCWEKYMKMFQDLGRLQHMYREARESNSQDPGRLRMLKEYIERGMTRYLSLRSALLEPVTLVNMMDFTISSSYWLVQIATDNPSEDAGVTVDASKSRSTHEICFPLPEEVSEVLGAVPEFLANNIIDFMICVRRSGSRNVDFSGCALGEILTFILVFMGSPKRMKNPHFRAKLAECLEALLPISDEKDFGPEQAGSLFPMMTRESLFASHPHIAQLVPCLLNVFVSIEVTGQSVAFEEKFNYRKPMYVIMKFAWEKDIHRSVFESMALDTLRNMENVEPPLFLRFVNLLMNDAIFLLDEALNYMSNLKTMLHAREAGEWDSLTATARAENESNVSHTGLLARFHNVMGRATINMLSMINGSEAVRRVFSHPTLVDRIAAMLNYFLLHLVGPKKSNFKVKDMNDYEFKPAEIVTEISTLYLKFSNSAEFHSAVADDGRSYSDELFNQAEEVLLKIHRMDLIPGMQDLALKIRTRSAEKKIEDELVADAPDEFLDPIMSTLMKDPVRLPTSGNIVDRPTIARHLLSDQSDPFNRQPLTMDVVQSDDALRQRIQDWINERLSHRPDGPASS